MRWPASVTTSRSSLLVVGAGGFVGAACTRALLAEGHAVFALEPARPQAVPHGATLLPGGITDAAAAMATARPDCVLNFAAFSTGAVGLARSGEAAPERALEVNALGFHALLQAAHQAGVRRVLWSSSTVAIGPATHGAREAEDVACAPTNSYGLSKLLAEQVAAFFRRVHGMDITGIRLPLIFGPGLWYEGAAAAVKRLAVGQPAAVSAPDQPFDAADVRDVARLFALLVARPGLAPLYHLAGHTTTWREIATLCDTQLLPAPSGTTWPLVSQARLEQDTGFTCAHDLRATLRALREDCA